MKWGIKCIAASDDGLMHNIIEHSSRGYEAWCTKSMSDLVHVDLNMVYHDLAWWQRNDQCVYMVEEYPS